MATTPLKKGKGGTKEINLRLQEIDAAIEALQESLQELTTRVEALEEPEVE